MPAYIISYDLRKQRNYDALYEVIRSYGTYAKITESTWAIVTSDSAKQIRDNLFNVTDNDDRLFVIKSGIEAAWRNVISTNEWLKENL